ncbi:MAG: hypothetical protein IKD44_07295 [Lentisphaeria bacterium]|nr:hypothetical protein [Lentisphaeria bacterium]
MISLSMGDFFSLILLLTMGWIAFLAFRLQSRGRRRDWHLTSRHLFQCDHCHLSFVPEKPVTLCRCPRCNAHCIKRSK